MNPDPDPGGPRTYGSGSAPLLSIRLTLMPVMRGGTWPRKTRSRSNLKPLSLNPSRVLRTSGSTVSNRRVLQGKRMLVQKERTCTKQGGFLAVLRIRIRIILSAPDPRKKRVLGIKQTFWICRKEKYDMQGTYLFL
jgi:hypothetical protein